MSLLILFTITLYLRVGSFVMPRAVSYFLSLKKIRLKWQDSNLQSVNVESTILSFNHLFSVQKDTYILNM